MAATSSGRASALITTPGDPGYALSFLRSLARASGDAALETAVQDAHTAFDRAILAQMLQDRIASLKSLA